MFKVAKDEMVDWRSIPTSLAILRDLEIHEIFLLMFPLLLQVRAPEHSEWMGWGDRGRDIARTPEKAPKSWRGRGALREYRGIMMALEERGWSSWSHAD